MKIGISSPSFCITPFEDMIELIAPHFEVWELIGEHEHYLPEIEDRVSDLKDSYDLELQLHLPFSDINLASVIKEARQLAMDRVLASIDSAAKLGIESVTLHTGSLSSITWRDRKWALNVARRSMEEIYARVVDCDVHMNLENLPYGKWMLGHTLEELNFLSKGFDEKEWGICYDIGHGFISAQQEKFLANPQLISNIHAHDNHGTEDSHLIPGKGKIDFPKIAKVLKASSSKVVIFEANNLSDGILGKVYVEDYFG